MKIGYLGVGEEPRRIDIRPDGNGSYLKEMQHLVGGPIEYFTPLYGDAPALVVNEEGLLRHLEPNRAVFANAEMEEAGYIDMMSYSHPVREGELYGILFGPILAVCTEWDEEGEEHHRDITDDEFSRLCRDLGEPDSGIMAIVAMSLARDGVAPGSAIR